jgi:D-lactate dehydrogenase
MRQVKSLLDPDGLLNPGVLLNEDPRLHLKNLKPCPTISPLADRCTECGFCEPRCPSRDLTLTPRQRIVVTREIARLGASRRPEDRRWVEALEADFGYEGVLTCATDSACQAACPVKIDTGALMKELRASRWPGWTHRLARLAAEHFAVTAAGARLALRAASATQRTRVGRGLLEWIGDVGRRVAPQLVSAVEAAHPFPRPAPPLPWVGEAVSDRAVVYFPSCLTRIVGELPGERLITPARAMHDVLRWAGVAVRVPSGIDGLCCGMAFASKGLFEAARSAAEQTAEALWRASEEGRLAVVTDASPCSGTLGDAVASALRERGRILVTHDFPSFWAREVLPNLGSVPQRAGTAILHPTCTLLKEGGLGDLLAVARAHAERVAVPRFAECCGFAGDRGFLVPELTASASRVEAAEIRRLLEEDPAAGLYSTCRTCEIGLGQAVGRPVRSLLHLVHEAVTGA